MNHNLDIGYSSIELILTPSRLEIPTYLSEQQEVSIWSIHAGG